MYTVFILFTLSMAIITANLLITLFCLMTVLSFPFIARKEEAMLESLFGERYTEYMKRTGRFLPRLRQSKEKT
jgi:protein-S-isoprenylcysteine O-methyltransferase Ste14